MAKKIIRFKVSVPTDEGFIGRTCNNPNCGKYFKIHAGSLKDLMFCPYCGNQFSREKFLTKDQTDHLREVATEKAKEYVYGELDKMFGRLARKHSHNKHFKIKHKPVRYRAKSIRPKYQELEVDSELICTKCQLPFQVFGIFGYCPSCGSENLRIYDANLEIIQQEVASSSNPQRALRHAYADLVSTFELISTNKAKVITSDTTNFQDLYGTRKFFKKRTGIDIFSTISKTDIRALQRVFQKRHVYEHNEGKIGNRYVQKMPEDSHLLEQKAELSIAELNKATDILRHVLDNLVDSTS